MRARELGMSLVELLVAVAIGLIGILIITQAYLVGDNFNRATLGEGGAQTNGLISLYTIERDARNAGYGFNNPAVLGCGQIYWYRDPEFSGNMGGSLPNISLAPVLIEHDTVAPANPDKITFLYSSEGERMLPTSIQKNPSKGNAATVFVDGVDGFQTGDVIMIVTPSGCVLGNITHTQSVSQFLQLNPGASGPNNPPAWPWPFLYTAGDSVLNMGDPRLNTYQIGGGKLQLVSALLSTGTATPTDLVDGIVDLRALYGKDTNNDNVVDTYEFTTPATGAEWLQVLAVKVAVLARVGNYEKKSVGASECDATTVVPTWSGSTAGGTVADNNRIATANPFLAISVASGSEDRCYRYRVFETTVPLRNMIWRP